MNAKLFAITLRLRTYVKGATCMMFGWLNRRLVRLSLLCLLVCRVLWLNRRLVLLLLVFPIKRPLLLPKSRTLSIRLYLSRPCFPLVSTVAASPVQSSSVVVLVSPVSTVAASPVQSSSLTAPLSPVSIVAASPVQSSSVAPLSSVNTVAASPVQSSSVTASLSPASTVAASPVQSSFVSAVAASPVQSSSVAARSSPVSSVPASPVALVLLPAFSVLCVDLVSLRLFSWFPSFGLLFPFSCSLLLASVFRVYLCYVEFGLLCLFLV